MHMFCTVIHVVIDRRTQDVVGHIKIKTILSQRLSS